MSLKRLLIFGTGFIARNYLHHLISKGNSASLIKVIYNEHKLSVGTLSTEHISMDIGCVNSLLESFKPTHILCLHGNSYVPAGTEVRPSLEDNALKTMGFLEAISRAQSKHYLKKILVIGSASEYGKYYDEAIAEDFPLHATSLYGLSKICLYNASMYYFERGLPIVHIRQFNTTGPRQRDCFVLPSFCKQIVEIEKGLKKPKIKVGDLTQERDFIDIRDTCSAYSLLFDKGAAGEVYNVSSGKYVTIKHLLDQILHCASLDGTVEIVKNRDLTFDENCLSHRLHADISKIEKIGFESSYSLSDTIKDTLDYWRKHV